MHNIILCGLPKSGKTTIGQLIAARLDWNFIDTDRLIERAYTLKTGRKANCRQICLEGGESAFRTIEKEQIHSLKNARMHIISLGGGSLDHPENLEILQSIGTLIYLESSVEVIWTRIQKGGIPAYLNQKDPKTDFYSIAQKRIPIYEQAAHYTIEAEGLDKKSIVEAITHLYKGCD